MKTGRNRRTKAAQLPLGKILTPKFFNRNSQKVAWELLGKYLVSSKNKAVKITEIEVYDGFFDKASHATKGQTARNRIMFGKPGYFYVYLVYGMYYMLNIVTREVGYPAAILIRGGVGETRSTGKKSTIKANKLTGPGVLTKFLGVDKNYDGLLANNQSGLWFEDRGLKIKKSKIRKLPRVGINYAGEYWGKRRLRFLIKE